MALAAISQTLDIDLAKQNSLTSVTPVLTADSKINIYVVNRSTASGNIRLAVSTSSPTVGQYLFYDFPIAAKGTLITNDVYAKAGEFVWIYAPENFNVRVEGTTLSDAVTTAAPTIASATTIAPTTPIVFVSGTTAIATITVPAALGSYNNRITLIPTGAFTTTTAGNIALISTAVVSRALTMTYDATTVKWYPSY